jgi:uncharacterized repeat protein (TIGR01451 family)
VRRSLRLVVPLSLVALSLIPVGIPVAGADPPAPRDLTPSLDSGGCAKYSPSGTYLTWLAGEDERQLVVANADGTDPVTIPLSKNYNCDVTFSPDETQLAFTGQERPGGALNDFGDIYIAATDGSGTTSLALTTSTFYNVGHPTWSPLGGTIIFGATQQDVGSNLFRIDPDGQHLARLTNYGIGQPVYWPLFSPDGSKVQFLGTITCPVSDLYVMNPDGSDITQLTVCRTDVAPFPVWSPDSTKIAFGASGTSNWHQTYVIDANGSNPSVQLTNFSNASSGPSAWSPDSSLVYLTRFQPHGEIDVAAADGSSLTPLTAGTSENDLGDISPDGQTVAFSSDRSCHPHVWVMSSSGGDDGADCPDVTPPTTTIATPPDGAHYAVGQSVTDDFSCQDETGGSGVHFCTDNHGQPTGTALYTGSPGDYQVTVRGADWAGNRSTVTHTYTVDPAEGPVLTLTKTDSPDPVQEQNPITYTMDVGNAGSGDANDVVLTDTIPTGTTFNQASSTQGSCSFASGTVTCNIGTVGVEDQPEVTLIVQAPNVTEDTVITNDASVSASNADTATASADTTVFVNTGGSTEGQVPPDTTVPLTFTTGTQSVNGQPAVDGGDATAVSIVVPPGGPGGSVSLDELPCQVAPCTGAAAAKDVGAQAAAPAATGKLVLGGVVFSVVPPSGYPTHTPFKVTMLYDKTLGAKLSPVYYFKQGTTPKEIKLPHCGTTPPNGGSPCVLTNAKITTGPPIIRGDWKVVVRINSDPRMRK